MGKLKAREGRKVCGGSGKGRRAVGGGQRKQQAGGHRLRFSDARLAVVAHT
jgi:hypothetical protein